MNMLLAESKSYNCLFDTFSSRGYKGLHQKLSNLYELTEQDNFKRQMLFEIECKDYNENETTNKLCYSVNLSGFNNRRLRNEVRFNKQQNEFIDSNQYEIESAFVKLADSWRQDTSVLSSVNMIVLHPAYQRIIGMGIAVVPFIMSELQKQPDHWFWALKSITGADPVSSEDAGNIMKMRESWLEYGKKSGYI